jgi:hypothetical protein
MIHTDEDDEFARIERENSMKGQPYHWEADAIKAAVLIEREECARIADEQRYAMNISLTSHPVQNGTAVGIANAIRARNDTSSKRVDITEEHKHDTPPQRTWVGLTDEEIEQGCKESWVTEQAFQSAAWWAEAKLKEKNHDY